jgi:DNA-binding NarL/FixJ family response regulator
MNLDPPAQPRFTGGMKPDQGVVRVLIADGDTRVRAALRSLLSAAPGFDVVADAASAATALELAREHAPTVALVGIQIPEGLGLVREVTGKLGIPTVAMSIGGNLRRPALAAGAHTFLEQDGSPELLLAALLAAAHGLA